MWHAWMYRTVLGTALVVAAAVVASAQPPVARPQPPPAMPGASAPAAQPKPAQPKPGPAGSALPATPAEPPPAARTLGVPVFPTAQFLGSYDAGRGQRFYLYGSSHTFADLVAYYHTVLKDKGELVFEEPATHEFDVGKFKDTDVAFAPGVTIKDYTWGGAPGYMNPRPGALPAYFPTIIQIVSPPPSGVAGRPR